MSKTITTGSLNGQTIGGILVNTSLPSNSKNHSQYGSSRYVEYVVMHYTGNENAGAWNNTNYSHNNNTEVSSHLFVDEKDIYQSVDLRAQAWHCGGIPEDKYTHQFCRNYNSIGIEMCTSGNYKVSGKTKENAAWLCAFICQLIGVDSTGVDKYVLRHWDVTRKSCPAQMAGDNNQEWATFKTRVKQILKGDGEMEYKQFVEYMERYKKEQAAKPAADWAESKIKAAKEYGIMSGDGNGKFRPQSDISRQEVAAVGVAIMDRVMVKVKKMLGK